MYQHSQENALIGRKQLLKAESERLEVKPEVIRQAKHCFDLVCWFIALVDVLSHLWYLSQIITLRFQEEFYSEWWIDLDPEIASFL